MIINKEQSKRTANGFDTIFIDTPTQNERYFFLALSSKLSCVDKSFGVSMPKVSVA